MQPSPSHLVPSAGRLAITAVGLARSLFMLARPVQADEAQARELLEGMTDYPEAQPGFFFDVDSSAKIVPTAAQKLPIASAGSAAMQRPNQIRVLQRGAFATAETVLDGQNPSALNREANIFGQLEFSGSVDQLIDTLGDDFQRPLPAADLLGSGGVRAAFGVDAPAAATETEIKDTPGLDEVAGKLVVEGEAETPKRVAMAFAVLAVTARALENGTSLIATGKMAPVSRHHSCRPPRDPGKCCRRHPAHGSSLRGNRDGVLDPDRHRKKCGAPGARHLVCARSKDVRLERSTICAGQHVNDPAA